MRNKEVLTNGVLPKLVEVKEITVRFSEVDSLHLVWHGHYLRYFEDGREAFGAKYGLGYLDVHQHGFVTPIVKSLCDYKSPLRYGDEVRIETEFVDTRAAKIIFRYKIYNKQTGKLAAVGETIQVFLDKNGELMITVPEFFMEWKRKWGLLRH